VPEELTKGRYAIDFNSDLSKDDKSYIGRVYPKKR